MSDPQTPIRIIRTSTSSGLMSGVATSANDIVPGAVITACFILLPSPEPSPYGTAANGGTLRVPPFHTHLGLELGRVLERCDVVLAQDGDASVDKVRQQAEPGGGLDGSRPRVTCLIREFHRHIAHEVRALSDRALDLP